jgi:hypothetical protein
MQARAGPTAAGMRTRACLPMQDAHLLWVFELDDAPSLAASYKFTTCTQGACRQIGGRAACEGCQIRGGGQ